jgi:hypothetical protein
VKNCAQDWISNSYNYQFIVPVSLTVQRYKIFPNHNNCLLGHFTTLCQVLRLCNISEMSVDMGWSCMNDVGRGSSRDIFSISDWQKKTTNPSIYDSCSPVRKSNLEPPEYEARAVTTCAMLYSWLNNRLLKYRIDYSLGSCNPAADLWCWISSLCLGIPFCNEDRRPSKCHVFHWDAFSHFTRVVVFRKSQHSWLHTRSCTTTISVGQLVRGS